LHPPRGPRKITAIGLRFADVNSADATPGSVIVSRFLRNALALVCLLVLAGCGYFFIYPQLRAAWHWREAHQEIDRGDFHAAAASLRDCLTVWPSSAETHFLLARTARRAADLDLARAQLAEARRLNYLGDQLDLEELLLQAQGGGITKVEPKLRELLAAGHAEEPLILEALVRGSLFYNFTKDASRWAGHWTERHPDDWQAHYWHGIALDAAAQPESAVEQLQRALQANADHADARLRLANLLFRSQRVPEAREQFHTLLVAEPDSAAALFGLAQCQRAAGEIDQARATVERALAREPIAGALRLRGMLALDREDPRQALIYFRRAEALDPNDRLTLKNLAAALRLLSDDAAAKQYDKRVLQIEKEEMRLDQLTRDAIAKPTDVALRAEAGTLSLHLGRFEEALHWLAGALILDHACEPARKALNECLDTLADPLLRETYRSLLATPPS
jgi:tetratricopeptide (TPR) repeat protein